MMTSYMSYKQRVAPLYRSELSRRLFATASGEGRAKRRAKERDGSEQAREKTRREWLRGRWLRRSKLWKRGAAESTAA